MARTKQTARKSRGGKAKRPAKKKKATKKAQDDIRYRKNSEPAYEEFAAMLSKVTHGEVRDAWLANHRSRIATSGVSVKRQAQNTEQFDGWVTRYEEEHPGQVVGGAGDEESGEVSEEESEETASGGEETASESEDENLPRVHIADTEQAYLDFVEQLEEQPEEMRQTWLSRIPFARPRDELILDEWIIRWQEEAPEKGEDDSDEEPEGSLEEAQALEDILAEVRSAEHGVKGKEEEDVRFFVLHTTSPTKIRYRKGSKPAYKEFIAKLEAQDEEDREEWLRIARLALEQDESIKDKKRTKDLKQLGEWITQWRGGATTTTVSRGKTGKKSTTATTSKPVSKASKKRVRGEMRIPPAKSKPSIAVRPNAIEFRDCSTRSQQEIEKELNSIVGFPGRQEDRIQQLRIMVTLKKYDVVFEEWIAKWRTKKEIREQEQLDMPPSSSDDMQTQSEVRMRARRAAELRNQ